MKHPIIWKSLTLGAVLTGLAVAGAGSAVAATGNFGDLRPMSVASAPAQVPFPQDDFFWDDDWYDDFPFHRYWNSGWGDDWDDWYDD